MRRVSTIAAVMMCVVLLMSSVAAAAAPGYRASNELEATITVLSKQRTGTWVQDGQLEEKDGKVYQPFVLKDGGETVSLAGAQVSEAGDWLIDAGKLWLNVLTPGGKYALTVKTAEDITYTTELDWAGPLQLFHLEWNLPSAHKVTEGTSFAVTGKASLTEALKNAGITSVGNILYVLEITDAESNPVGPDELSVVATGGQSLGYDTAGAFWYWGPRTGFTFDTSIHDDAAETTFDVTFKRTGTYDVKAYVVQLP